MDIRRALEDLLDTQPYRQDQFDGIAEAWNALQAQLADSNLAFEHANEIVGKYEQQLAEKARELAMTDNALKTEIQLSDMANERFAELEQQLASQAAEIERLTDNYHGDCGALELKVKERDAEIERLRAEVERCDKALLSLVEGGKDLALELSKLIGERDRLRAACEAALGMLDKWCMAYADTQGLDWKGEPPIFAQLREALGEDLDALAKRLGEQAGEAAAKMQEG